MTTDPRSLALAGIEVWKPVPNSPYEASNLGRMRNPKTGKFVGTCLLKNGYLSLPGLLVHRAVLSAFDGPRPPTLVVRHEDDDRSNNALPNLSWGTRAENAADTAAAGRLRSRSGEVRPLGAEDVEEVFALIDAGRLTQRQAGERLHRSAAWVAGQVRRRRVPVIREMASPVTPEDARAMATLGTEVWAPAVGTYGLEVSNLGRIRSPGTGKVYRFAPEKRSGYVKLTDGGLLHKVVLSSFEAPPFEGAVVRHGPDPSRSNNALHNLRWGTYKENGEDTKAHGRNRPGEQHGRAVLTDAQVAEGLRRYAAEGWTAGQLSDFLNGIGQGNASDIINGRSWSHVPAPSAVTSKRERGTRRVKDADRPAPVSELAVLVARVQQRAEEARDRVFRLVNDEQVLVSREELILVTQRSGAAAVEEMLLPAVFDFFRDHVIAWGWMYPVPGESLTEALATLRSASGTLSSTSRLGCDFLRAAFPSYWNTDGGPVRAFADDKTLRGVLRYRLGINNSKDYTYTLSSGEEVTTRETFDINLKNVRRGFVVQRKAPSFFKPAVAQSIYRRWVRADEPVVWDCSGGFGGRLLGFAAAFPRGVYYACEPAAQTHHDLSALGVALVEEGHLLHAEVLKQGSETVSFAPASLDFVFTSPPYFDLERYFDEPGQCWRDYPTEALWAKRYVLPTLRAAFEGLKPGCFAVFNVDDLRRAIFVSAAEEVGFAFVEEQRLSVGADHFARKRGKEEARTEPLLVFRRP